MFWCWTNNNFRNMHKVRNRPFSFLGMSFANYWLYKKISRKAPWLFWGASENLHSAAGLFPHNISFRPLLYLLEEPCLLVWLLRSQNLFAIFRNDIKLNGRLPSTQSLSWLTSPRPNKSEKLAKIIVKSCKPRIPSEYFFRTQVWLLSTLVTNWFSQTLLLLRLD